MRCEEATLPPPLPPDWVIKRQDEDLVKCLAGSKEMQTVRAISSPQCQVSGHSGPHGFPCLVVNRWK